MRFKPADLFTVFVIFVLVGAVAIASQWVLRASIIILVLGSLGIVMAIAQLAMDCFLKPQTTAERGVPKMELPSFEDADPNATFKGTIEIWGWLLGLLVSIKIIGLPVSLPLFVLVYTRFYGASWKIGVILSLLIGGFIFGVYEQIMHVYWPDSVLGDLLNFDD
jgi:hypothetical protein